jgi:NAD(P)-dependent dehydrogenase (short-subunit alcohol dehydrogenase family)
VSLPPLTGADAEAAAPAGPTGDLASSEATLSALVTGATGGIGRVIAERLALMRYRLTVSGRKESMLADVAADLAGTTNLAGTKAELQAVRADMTVEADVRALAQSHSERFGSLDLLVICAGTGNSGTIDGYPMRRFDRQVDVNIRAPFTLVQECLPALRSAAAARPAHGARIVAIASLVGMASEAGLAVYGATKAALISLCQSINSEESSAGVSATAIAPGYVDTDMSTWVHDRIDPGEMIKSADIAELVVALTQMSASAIVPLVPISRPGRTQWRA